MQQFVQERLQDVRGLLFADVSRAKAELSKHCTAITLTPTASGFRISDDWNLLADVWMVPGARHGRNVSRSDSSGWRHDRVASVGAAAEGKRRTSARRRKETKTPQATRDAADYPRRNHRSPASVECGIDPRGVRDTREHHKEARGVFARWSQKSKRIKQGDDLAVDADRPIASSPLCVHPSLVYRAEPRSLSRFLATPSGWAPRPAPTRFASRALAGTFPILIFTVGDSWR